MFCCCSCGSLADDDADGTLDLEVITLIAMAPEDRRLCDHDFCLRMACGGASFAVGADEAEDEVDAADDSEEVDDGPAWFEAERRCGRPPTARDVAREVRAVDCVGEGDEEDVERSRTFRGLVREPAWWYRAPVDGARGWGRRKVGAPAAGVLIAAAVVAAD